MRARKLVSDDGRVFIQLRVDLGVLQMCLDGRPDGERPHGHESVLNYLRRRVGPEGIPLELSDKEKEEIVREMMQFYRRRVSLMTLGEQAKTQGDRQEADACYRRAIRDADHNLAMLDLLQAHCADAEFVSEHAQYRAFILMHKTVCLAERALLTNHPDLAVECIKSGMAAIGAVSVDRPEERMGELAGESAPGLAVQPFIAELQRFEEQVRGEYHLKKTLWEQLNDAVENEDYELAARLRDAIARLKARDS